MPRPTSPQTRDRARVLRREMTVPERLVWAHLRDRKLDGLKFRRQATVGPYIADFLCEEHRLAVELDGESHEADEAASHDARRTAYLVALGYRVVRYPNDEVLANLDGVLLDIARQCGRDVRWW